MRCPECGSTRVATDARGETTCQACGLVLAEPERVLAEPLAKLERAAGVRLAGRLAKAQKRATEASASERRWIDAAQQTRRAGGEIQCPADVAEEAARLLKRAQKEGLTQGRNLRALAAGALLASCRRLHLARSEEQVAEAVGIDVRELRAGYRALTRGLGLAVPKLSAHAHLAQVSSKLRVPPEVEGEARQILLPVCGTKNAAGRNPLGWAAAALVLAAKRKGHALSVNQAAKAAGVSNSTVALRLADLESFAGELSTT